MEKYKILKTIGEGSFGRVYEAIHKDSQNKVALKIIGKVFIANYREYMWLADN